MLNVSILYEDKDVLVVNKPSGLIVHSDGRTEEPTLVDWILEKYPKMKGVGEPLRRSPELGIRNQPSRQAGYELGIKTEEEKAPPVPNSKLQISNSIPRPGIVHRLDRDTSGVLVIAKNQKSFQFLKKQFQEREIEKSYRAFVYGVVKSDEGVIDRPIARSRKDFRMWSAQRGARGAERDAVTEYKVLARIPAGSSLSGGQDQAGYSFLELKPKTGRTHQLRVHLKAINHPIVCDPLYAPKRDTAFGFTRTALHAYSIKFTLPSGKPISVEAPYPEDFKNAIKNTGYGLKI